MIKILIRIVEKPNHIVHILGKSRGHDATDEELHFANCLRTAINVIAHGMGDGRYLSVDHDPKHLTSHRQ